MSSPVSRDGRVTDMTVSHTESGYLTDSAMSAKDVDSITYTDGLESRNSGNSTTPAIENLMTFSDSSSTSPSLLSPDGEDTLQEQLQNDNRDSESSATSKSTESDRIKQLQNLAASLDLTDVSQDRSAIDDIFATNFTASQNGNIPNQSQVAEANGQNKKTDEVRTRSKSAAFPIAKQKEGVSITEDLLSKSLPHGKIVRRDTGLIEFIADDLQEKIRRSSPMSKTASEVSSSRRSSDLSITSVDSFASSSMATSVTSGMSRSYPQSPDCIPPIDPIAVHEIENQARSVAENVQRMLDNLRNGLHKMSAISVGCEEAYKTSVDVTCDSVDSSIKSMYALMAKCEELSQNMEPVYRLASQIKEIKRLLDRFESQLGDKP